ncbi:MAG: hypothetical protein HKN04_10785 [Rhodothermaceae bacterium]|nr:hypothetical protein [Rhodothermaceae bacterium]
MRFLCYGSGFLLLILLAGCDSSESLGPQPEPQPEPLTLAPATSVTLQANAVRLDVNDEGEVRNGFWLPSGESPTNDNGTVWNSGLWISALQDGTPHAGLIHDGISNYRATLNGEPSGVYFIERDRPLTNPEDWPTEAPMEHDGSPRIYGDAMAWSTQHLVVETYGLYTAPIEGLQIQQAVYAYGDGSAEDIVFVRYELINTTDTALNEVRVGFGQDVDLKPDLEDDFTGFLLDEGITYTYDLPALNDAATARLWAAAFLDTPQAMPLNSHRIMRENNDAPQEFSFEGFDTPTDVAYALEGLSNEGTPMIDPTTNEPTAFAFTGNPATGTGWIDGRIVNGNWDGHDVRSLLSVNPFTLGPGERTHFTVGLFVLERPVISEALDALASMVTSTRATSALWDFD